MKLRKGTATARRGTTIGAALAVAAAVVTVVAAPTAQAAAPSRTAAAAPGTATSTTFTLLPGVSTYRASAGGAQVTVTRSSKVSPAIAISCTVTASDPFRFYGGPFPWPSGVEGLAHTTCNNVVNSIDLLVVLFRGTTAVASNETVTYSTLQGAADTEYQYTSGSSWQTGAQAAVAFPDGTSGVSTPAYSNPVTIP